MVPLGLTTQADIFVAAVGVLVVKILADADHLPVA
jgi:hypothetical protein